MGHSSRTQATSIVLNAPPAPEPQRTYVTFGGRRGGTSMVAGVLRALGLDLGRVGKRKNNEDAAFQHRPMEDMRHAIARRNEEHDVWGWKFPQAVNYLPALYGSLRNPYFVVVYRDPVAAALGQSRRDRERVSRTLPVSLHECNACMNANTGFVLASQRPCLLISNEKALQEPGALVDEIADFLYVPRPTDSLRARILEYVSPGQYKAFDDFFGPAAS